MRVHAIGIYRLVICYHSEEACLRGVITDGRSVTLSHVMKVQPCLELHEVLHCPIWLFNEESPFLGAVEANAKVVTHIGEAKDVHNTPRVVPNLSRISRELAHLVHVRPAGIASDPHVSVGCLGGLEKGPVGEYIHSGPSVNVDP